MDVSALNRRHSKVEKGLREEGHVNAGARRHAKRRARLAGRGALRRRYA